MSNKFAKVAQNLQGTPYIIPVFVAVIAGIVIGCFAFYEDYQSSLHGYNLLPTRKSGQEVVQIIAMLPQVGQIIFFFMFGRSVVALSGGGDRANNIYFTIGFFLLLFDLGTDMFFKASGLPWHVWVIAGVESITVFTIGSELMLTACVGLFFELGPEVLKILGGISARWLGEDEEVSRSNGQHQRQ